MEPLQVSKAAAAADPHLIWNTFIKLCGWYGENYTPTQRVAHLAFFYDAEVLNGGHYQYFENRGRAEAQETIVALGLLGAKEQQQILADAVGKSGAINPKGRKVETREDFVAGALEGNYATFDVSYGACKRTMEDHLKAWLHSNMDEFINWIE